MHQGMQERSWSHRSGKKKYGGRHISANLNNVPAPVNSNAKRFLAVETNGKNKGRAWEVENQFRDFAVSTAEDFAVSTVYCLTAE